ncbi:MAG TPA: DUF6659 family protein [Candidatus Nitrosotenuis sp.]
MSPLTVTDLSVFNEICKRIMSEPGVRFAGIVNQMGNRIAGGFREDVVPFVDYTKENMMYMELVLDLRMRGEFDGELGKVQYIHSRRDKVNMVSIPLGNLIAVLATELEVNVQRLVNLAINEFKTKSDTNLSFDQFNVS